ncbi:hypothetical protein MKY14_16320 [Paenibacillus sp. FSL R5-0887]|uniref:hypothetical protein n=1 Tax=Paenibacillus sp. FSL R5-0887 TaxID=2921662 RepID=UPI0030F67027
MLVSKNVDKPPAVHIGFLPQKNRENAEISEFPFILVRPSTGDDQQDSSKVTVKLVFGVKAEDQQGFIDLFNIMEQVRIEFLRQRIINRRYKMELPYKWEFFDEQPYPEWYGQATTIWTLPAIQEEEGLF